MFNRMTMPTVALAAASAMISGAAIAADNNTLDTMVPIHELAPLDLDRLAEEDAIRDADGLPYRFAIPSESFISPGNDGLWDRNADGLLRWRMRIKCVGSPHINLGFEHWNMPESAELIVYSMDERSVRGPFNSLDNINEGQLWLPIVIGDDIMVSITCNDVDRLAVEQDVIITKINAGYRGFDDPNRRGSSESCNIDVVCAQGDPWQDEIPSVGVMTVNGYLTCTGFMINNTAQDERPLFMTADHCGVTNSSDSSLVVYWNHQNSYCRTPGSSDSGGNGNGNYNQYSSGSQHLADDSYYDVTLVEMNSSPNSNWGVTFAGWSRSNSASVGASIHHPECAEKRISFPDYVNNQGQYWQVNWDEGRTAPGSSGSPLFDGNHRAVGQLTGGSSYCPNDLNDYYGRGIAGAWSSLSSHLDPLGQSPSTLDTLVPGGGSSGACCLGTACIYGSESACDSVGGIFQGAGVQCADVDCGADPTGGCCVGTSCYVETEADCSGTYLGDGTNCSGDPCAAPTGGCCYSTGCSVQTEDDCSGTYLGDGTSCAGDPCGSSDPALLGLSWTIVGANLVDDASDTWTVDVYAHLSDGCRLDAVAGDANQQKMVSTTSSFYQNPYGGPTSQSVNPLLFPTFPDLEYDSFATIGLTNSDGNAMSDIGINWTNFENGGSVDSTDGSWYVTPDDAQGDGVAFSNEDCENSNGVLIARLTSRDLNSVIMIEALFQGKDAAGATWQSSSSVSISYDDCNVQCTGDFTGDGQTDVSDLLEVIAGWGTYDVNDLLTVIGDWGCGP